jgi:cytochrome c553
MRKFSSLFVIAGAVWLAGAALVAQAPPAAGAGRQGGAPQAPMDLKVLPKSWSRQQVGALMQTFNTSLGVQCSHCHEVDKNAPPPLPGQNPRLDYALDTKPEKEVARAMIKMTMDLNAAARKPTDEASVEKLSCFTCHRGDTAPAKAPAEGWGRGNFALTEAGPVVPARGAGGGPRGGGPAAPATPPGN